MMIEIVDEGETQRIAIRHDRLDSSVTDRFKDRVYPLAAAGHARLVLDLAEVGFADSSGIGALVGLHRRLGPGTRLELAGTGPRLRRILDLMHLSAVFTFRESPAEC